MEQSDEMAQEAEKIKSYSYIDYNESIKNELVSKGIWEERLSGVMLAQTFKCVECGCFVPSPIVRYYKDNISEIKCYLCQKQ